MKKKVMVGMSGGVDSSVAALILQEQGYEVYGITLKLRPDEYMQGSLAGGCCSLDDITDARRVCAELGIAHYVLNFTDVFSKKVIDYFASEYALGRTPNPCVACNRYIKFDEMLNKALSMDIDYIATGHYAVVEQQGENFILKKSPSSKDQSYVLYSLTQRQLRHTLFPLGNLTDKGVTRKIAEERGLPVAHKPDSQEICFVENNDYCSFLERYSGKKAVAGNFVDMNGKVLGSHKGISHYTIGQRKGLGISFGKPMYVTNINAENNTVTLGEEGSQYKSSLTADDINWIAGRPHNGARIQAKVRYAAMPADAVITFEDEDVVSLEFDQPQRSVTPGQTVAFYQGDIVLGGGTIR